MFEVRLASFRIRHKAQGHIVARFKVEVQPAALAGCNRLKPADTDEGWRAVRGVQESLDILDCLAFGQLDQVDLVGLAALIENLPDLLSSLDLGGHWEIEIAQLDGHIRCRLGRAGVNLLTVSRHCHRGDHPFGQMRQAILRTKYLAKSNLKNYMAVSPELVKHFSRFF